MSVPLSLSETHFAPGTDLLTFSFEGPYSVDQQKPLYIDAEDPARCLNASQFKRLVRRFIAGFKAAGLQRGDSVLVHLANNFLYSAIFFAIIGAGGVHAGINPTSRALELDHSLELVAPKFIITSQDVLLKVLPIAANRNITSDRIYVLDLKSFSLHDGTDWSPCSPRNPDRNGLCADFERQRSLLDLLRYGESDWIRFSDDAIAKATPAAMYSTSGTSGLPKAAVLSHYAMVCQHISIQTDPPYQVRRLMTLPFFHIFAALFVHILPVRHGQPLYILPRFHLDQYVDCINKFEITDTFMAPPMVHALNRYSLPLADMLKTIRYIGVGGAPIDASTMEKFQFALHKTATLSQVWGMTEIGAAMLYQYPSQSNLGSIGRPLPGYEMKLIDSLGNTVLSDHESGELYVRYAGSMTGYRGQPPLMEGGWYATGDIMSRVKDQYFVVGRCKELIKVNGFQVAPAELEATLLLHPFITDAAVIGVLRPDGVTEVPRAFIIRASDPGGRCSSLSSADVYAFASDRLASYKRLEGGVVFVDEIPRTASGKIQRFKLAQMDRYRSSVTELLMKNDTMVEKKEVYKVKHNPPGKVQRKSARRAGLGRRANEEVRGVSKAATPKRKPRERLTAKMKALEQSRILEISCNME